MKVLAPILVDDAAFVSSNVPEADYAAWSAATTYALGDRVILVSTHRVYESLIAANLNHNPAADPASWMDVGPTSRWALWDELLTTATINTSSIDVVLSLGAVSDIVLQGVIGSSVAIYSAATLIRTVAVPAPVSPATSVTLVITGLGITAGNNTRVVLTGTGAIAIAHMTAGAFADIGQTQRDIELEMTDFSAKQTDSFGVVSVARRGYSRRLSANVSIVTADIDRVTALLESLLDTVCFWVAMDGYDALALSGFYTSFDHVIAHRAGGTYSLTIEGLVRDDAVIAAGPSNGGKSPLGQVSGISARVVAGGVVLMWDRPADVDIPNTAGVEIREGSSWGTAVQIFFGSATQHTVFWPTVGTHSYLFKHIGYGTESLYAVSVPMIVNADGTITFGTVTWLTDAGLPAAWDGGAAWGTTPVSYLVDTAELQAEAATTVITTFQAGPIVFSSGA